MCVDEYGGMIICCDVTSDLTVKTDDRGHILILGPMLSDCVGHFSYFRFEEDYVICSDVHRAFLVFVCSYYMIFVGSHFVIGYG